MNPRLFATLAMAVIAMTAFFTVVAPIPQDPAYHRFADTRAIFGIANFWNVTSNLPFLLAGLWGVRYVFREGGNCCVPGLELTYVVFFAGVFLTALGSAWYHLQPDNATLVWDRLPMTIAFAGLFSIIIGEFIDPQTGRSLLIPLLVLGAGSVEYWAFTEQQGVGDLRPYAMFQFAPVLLSPIVLIRHRPAFGDTRYFWLLLLFYAAAKIAEFFDHAIYSAGGFISGHSVKHLFAACAAGTLLFALMRRAPNAQAAVND